MKKKLMLLLVAIASLTIFSGCGVDVELLTKEVKSSMEETFDKKPETRGIKVVSLVLVHESGNNYSGIAELSDGTAKKSVSVDVVCDGESFKWEIMDDSDD